MAFGVGTGYLGEWRLLPRSSGSPPEWHLEMKILACNSNRPLAEAISACINQPLTKASIRRFSDMEVFVEIEENIRGQDVFVIK